MVNSVPYTKAELVSKQIEMVNKLKQAKKNLKSVRDIDQPLKWKSNSPNLGKKIDLYI